MRERSAMPLLSAFLLAASLLVATDSALAGAPLKGVDVKLGRNPGGSPVARTTTDANGAFAFADVPAGSYTLTFELGPAPGTAGGAAAAKEAKIDVVAGGKAIVGYWDFERRTAFDPAGAATAKAAAGGTTLTVDMKAPGRLTGTCEAAVVKSKSNISNN